MTRRKANEGLLQAEEKGIRKVRSVWVRECKNMGIVLPRCQGEEEGGAYRCTVRPNKFGKQNQKGSR